MKKFKELVSKDVVNTPIKRFVFLVLFGLMFIGFGVFMSQTFLQTTPVVMSDEQYEDFTGLLYSGILDDPDVEIVDEGNSNVAVDSDNPAGTGVEGWADETTSDDPSGVGQEGWVKGD